MLWDRYDALILDLDGVVYIGASPVAHAIESLNAVAADGVRLTAATNNAARAAAVVGEHLRSLGLAIADNDVVTSAQAGAALLARQVAPGSEVLAVGGEGVPQALSECGLTPVRAPRDFSAAGEVAARVAAVMQGHGTETCWWDLNTAAFAVGLGKIWVATNRDATVPTEHGFGVGNGGMVAAVMTATGRNPEVAGKPQPTLFAETKARIGARNPLVVGDRLDTDVDGAIAAGMDSILVCTGVHQVADALARPVEQRPTYIIQDLRGLLLPESPETVGLRHE